MKLSKILGFALGPVASAAFGLITIPIVAWAFSADDVGRLNILQTTLSFCVLLVVLGLDQAYVREFHESPQRARLLKACVTPGFIVFIIAAIATIPFSKNISKILYGTATPVFYWITLCCAATAFLSRFLSLILRMQERGLAFSMSQIIPKVLQLTLILLLVALGIGRSFSDLLWITAFSSFTVLIVCGWNTRKQWIPAITARPTKQETTSLLKFGFPLIFSGMAYWGLNATSTFVLRSQSSLSELGIYSVTSSFSGVAVIFQSIFTVVWAPTVYKWVSEGVDMSRIDDVAKKALVLACIVFVAVGSFSWITEYLLPPQYIEVKYLLVCAIAPPLLYTLSEITSVGIGITRRTTLTIWITLLALLTNCGLSLWLVPTRGAAGAVIANTVGYLVFFIARTEVSAYVWRSFSRFKMYIILSLAVIFSVATVISGPTFTINHSLAWLCLAPIVGWHFRHEIIIAAKATVRIKF